MEAKMRAAITASIAREQKAIERKSAEIEAHKEMVIFYENQLNPQLPAPVGEKMTK